MTDQVKDPRTGAMAEVRGHQKCGELPSGHHVLRAEPVQVARRHFPA